MHVQRRASWPVKNAQALSAEMAQTLRVLSATSRERQGERETERAREIEGERERDETVGQDVCGVD